MEGASGGHCDVGTQRLYSSSRCGREQAATKTLHISMDGTEQKREAVGLQGWSWGSTVCPDSSSSHQQKEASERAHQEPADRGVQGRGMSSRVDVRMGDRGPGALALSGQGPESLAWPAGYRLRPRAKPWLSERGVK